MRWVTSGPNVRSQKDSRRIRQQGTIEETMALAPHSSNKHGGREKHKRDHENRTKDKNKYSGASALQPGPGSAAELG